MSNSTKHGFQIDLHLATDNEVIELYEYLASELVRRGIEARLEAKSDLAKQANPVR